MKASQQPILAKFFSLDHPLMGRLVLFILGLLGLFSGMLIHTFLPNAYYPAYIYLSSSGLCLAIVFASFAVPHINRYFADYASFCYLFLYLGIVYITYLNRFDVPFTLILLAAHVFFATSFKNFVEFTLFSISSLSLIILCITLTSVLRIDHPFLLIAVFTFLTLFAGIKVWIREQMYRRMSNGSFLISDLLNNSQYAIFLLDEQCRKLNFLNTTSIKYLQVLTGYGSVDCEQLFNLLGIDPTFVVNRFRSASYNLQEKGFCTIESYNGQEVYFELYISKVRSLTGDNILIKLLDISEHKRREKHLKRSISVNESLVHAIPDVLIRVDMKGVIQSVRTSSLLPSMNVANEFVGHHFMEIVRRLSPRNMHQATMLLFEKSKVAGGVQQMELEVVRQRGSRFYDLRLVRLEDEEEILAIVRDITDAKEVELALKQSEQNYREIFNSGKDGIVLADMNTLLPIDVNEVTYELLGYQSEVFKKLPVHTLCRQEDAAKLAEHIKLARQGDAQTLTCQFIRADESLMWAEVGIKCAEIRGKSRMMLIIRDIEERIHFTQKIQRYADMFESMDVGMAIMHMDDPQRDDSFRFVSCNAFAEHLFETPSKRIQGRLLDEVMPMLREQGIPARMLEAHASREILIEDGLLFPDQHGAEQFWQLKVVPLSGWYVGLLLEVVTERKRATERLKYQALLADSVSDAIISTRPDFIIESWNKAAEDIYGWTAEEVIGKDLKDIFQSIYVSDSRESARQRLFDAGFWEGEIIQERKGGQKITVLSSFSIITDEQGEARRIVILNRDITDQKERELIIRKSERKFKDLFNSSPEAILLAGMDGVVLDANTSACELYKMPLTELTGKQNLELVPESYRSWARQQYQDLIQGKTTYVESVILTAKGAEVPVEIRAGRMNLEGSPAMLFHITNIQERLKSEAALRQSEQKYRTLVEKMNEGLVLTNTEDVTLFVNDSMSHILGLSKEEMLGRKTYEYLGSVHANDLELQEQQDRLRKQGLTDQYELQITRKNGDPIWVLVTGAPYKDSDGEVLGTIAIITNITDRKRTELKLQETNNELDAFVYKASHDLKGPLASIIGLANIAQEEVQEPKALEYFEMIRKSTRRLDTILLDLIDVTRINKATLESKPVDLQKLLDDIINSLRHQPQSEQIDFIIELNGIRRFVSDHKLLTSIFQNLIVNSINYHDPGKEVPYVRICARETPDGLHFEVSDNGLGIPAKLQPKVFEMFFRGNTRSNGSGLGLYIVKNSIEKLKGKCHLESEEGEGTTFSFTLPYLKARSESFSEPVEAAE